MRCYVAPLRYDAINWERLKLWASVCFLRRCGGVTRFMRDRVRGPAGEGTENDMKREDRKKRALIIAKCCVVVSVLCTCVLCMCLCLCFVFVALSSCLCLFVQKYLWVRGLILMWAPMTREKRPVYDYEPCLFWSMGAHMNKSNSVCKRTRTSVCACFTSCWHALLAADMLY